MSRSFAGATHLTHGDGAGGAVQAAGAHSIVVVRDLLTVGPCAVDPLRHREARIDWWQLSDEEAARFVDGRALATTLAALPAEQPLILWATLAWSDQLWLWWTLDALSAAAVAPERLWWARPETAHPLASVGGATRTALEVALDGAVAIDGALAHEASALWRAYADESPLAFDAARRAGSERLPALGASAEPHGWWFPRRQGDGLLLSELDALLLGALGGGPRTAAALVAGASGVELCERVFFPFGDTFLLRRLDDWVGAGAVVREVGASVAGGATAAATANASATAGAPGGDRWHRVTYRRSAAGERLVRDGLGSVADAPPLFVGGCRVHDAAAPWVRVADGRGWHLAAG